MHRVLIWCYDDLLSNNLGMSFSSFYYEAGDIVLHFDKEGRAFDDGDNETHLKRSDRSQLLSFLRQAQLAHRWIVSCCNESITTMEFYISVLLTCT